MIHVQESASWLFPKTAAQQSRDANNAHAGRSFFAKLFATKAKQPLEIQGDSGGLPKGLQTIGGGAISGVASAPQLSSLESLLPASAGKASCPNPPPKTDSVSSYLNRMAQAFDQGQGGGSTGQQPALDTAGSRAEAHGPGPFTVVSFPTAANGATALPPTEERAGHQMPIVSADPPAHQTLCMAQQPMVETKDPDAAVGMQSGGSGKPQEDASSSRSDGASSETPPIRMGGWKRFRAKVAAFSVPRKKKSGMKRDGSSPNGADAAKAGPGVPRCRAEAMVRTRCERALNQFPNNDSIVHAFFQLTNQLHFMSE